MTHSNGYIPKARGQRKTQDPCETCFLHRERCLCTQIPRLTLKTKLSLIIHAKEMKRTTNTGRLAIEALVNSQLFIRGKCEWRDGELFQESLDLTPTLQPEYRSVLFYPAADALELTPKFVALSSLPIHLIVPDGNWRQASKVHYRHPELKHLPRVMIKTANTSIHHLRTETTPEGMATLQAIAEAMGVIEGPDVRDLLLALYQLKLERTLQGRGTVA